MLVDALSEIVRTLLARIDPKPRADIVEVRRKVLRYMRAGDADRLTTGGPGTRYILPLQLA